jgi:hypothetical protein
LRSISGMLAINFPPSTAFAASQKFCFHFHLFQEILFEKFYFFMLNTIGQDCQDEKLSHPSNFLDDPMFRVCCLVSRNLFV